MSMTVKQLAEELGVSKLTISKAISDLGLQGNLHKIGNRFILEETEIQAIKSQITQTPRPQETEKMLISALQAQIETLQQHNALLSQQLSTKDNQIAMQADQIKQLTDSLHDTTAALTAAQALHAGTIQQQLTDKQAGSEGQSEGVSEPEERQGFWKRIFRRS